MMPPGPAGPKNPTDSTSPTVTPAKIRRVLAASVVGTVIEWYDFVLFALASSLIFNQLFFPTFSPAAGTLASFLTLAVGFVARPLGGLVISHFGDRYGRKPALIATIALMGASTVAIGLLPTYEQIGILAPVLLVVLRLLQGLGAGAEYAGALTLVAEYVPSRRKGFYTAFVLSATVVGLLLASIVFRGIVSAPQEALFSWVWRVPFLLSAVLLLVAFYIRHRLEETPEYVRALGRAEEHRKAASIPLLEVLRSQPKVVLCGFLAMAGANAVTYILNTFSVNYMVNTLSFESTTALNILIVASIAGIVGTPLMGAVSDRFGHGRVYVAGTVFVLCFAAPMFWLLDTGSVLWATVGLTIGYGLGFGAVAGSQGAFLAGMFPTRTRFTGIAFIRETNGATVAGFTPFVAAWLTELAGGRSDYVVGFVMVMCAISIVGVLAIRREAFAEREPGAA